ncbi:hypothetical protein Tco_0159738 [Tanacetum coccineum]
MYVPAGGGGGGGYDGGDLGGDLGVIFKHSLLKNFLYINAGQILKRARSGACIAQSTASATISSTALLTWWGILRFSNLYSLDLCGGGGGRVIVVVIIEVFAVDVGSGESDCIVMRSITGVVIGGTEEVS